MIVPQFWAEARLHQARSKGRPQVTVRRFGWSDASQSDAQRMADERVKEAFARVVAGEELPRRERAHGYWSSEGVPIREEILARHGAAVITRNLYGAHCLNTPDVAFADVDVSEPRIPLPGIVIVAGFATFAALRLTGQSLWAALGGALAMLVLVPLLLAAVNRWRAAQGKAAAAALKALESFFQMRPGWRGRVYRTPAGFRVLLLHDTFQPDSPAVQAMFSELSTDRRYATLCTVQQCFRARLTGKPWRMKLRRPGMTEPGRWPVTPERAARRAAWISEYDAAALRYAACQFVAEYGAAPVHPKAAAVAKLHDTLGGATSGMPLA